MPIHPITNTTTRAALMDNSLLNSHVFLTRDLTAFFLLMGLGQGGESSCRGAIFSIFFKALNIELKFKNSSSRCYPQVSSICSVRITFLSSNDAHPKH
jgi:hypothetical protein